MAKKPQKKSSSLADYIQRALETKYRTQLEAAKDIGISQSQLSSIINRRTPAASEAVIKKICGKLGLSKKEGVYRLSLAKELKARQFSIGRNVRKK